MTTYLNIHSSIKEKLQYFHLNHKIPNIIFHGQSGTGKRTIVNEFIHRIYNNDKEKIKDYVMYVNCAHGKGIKFIREELKFFAKTQINSNGGDFFKSIILLNADKLTVDAQSALRRCIELFSHNTRFFIIVEDKYKLLKPILSRFCEIHVPEPIINNVPINLYKYNVERTFNLKSVKQQRLEWLKKEINKTLISPFKIDFLILLSSKLYEKGYSGLDIIELVQNTNFLQDKISFEKKYELLIAFNKVKKELRNEKLLIMFMLNFLLLDNNFDMENINFM
jgi:DNA polymerase III delta prime subunit